MEQSNAAAASEEEADLVDYFNQDESSIADILLLLSNSKPKKPNKKGKGNDFSVTHESQSILPDWVCKRRRSATNRKVKAPPASDTSDKDKMCFKKELPPSPATPLLFSSSESEEKKLNRKIRVIQKKKRQVLKKNVEGLVGCRDSLKVELQKVGTYHSQLQAINSALKTMKQDLSSTTAASNNGNGHLTMHNNHCVMIQQLQQQQQPYNMIVNQNAADASCPSSLNCSWQTQIQNFHQSCRSSSSSQLGMGALLFLSSGPQLVVNKRPDLNAPPSESGYLYNVHPSDLRRTFSDAEKKAKYAAARKLRMNNNRMKRKLSSSSSSTTKIKMQTFMSR